MTFAVLAALAATFLSLPSAFAQDGSRYTVWSTVIFTRTGERTPSILGDLPTQLTSLGAQQQYANGQFFRERYLTSMGSENGVDGAPISMMSPSIPDVRQIYVTGLDFQYTLSSAQAFMQGFYPPFQLVNNGTEEAAVINPLGMLANGSYIESPLSGYQYTQINALGAYDPEYPYIGGNLYCQGWDESAVEYILTDQFTETAADSSSVYRTTASEFLSSVPQVNDEQWNYVNAYAIFDYLNYQNMHNATVREYFNSTADGDTGISYLDSLRFYADQQQFAQLGNLYADNNVTSAPWYNEIVGSISTISGNMLAAKMASLLETNIMTGGEYNKFNLLVGDYHPMMSFFALMGLPAQNANFYGLPDFGSVAVLELYSKTEGSEALTYPTIDDLWVRFYFRNGTDSSEEYRAYSLFGLGPDQFEMPYGDFMATMASYAIGNIGFWCQQCGPEFDESTRVFCSYWNASNSLYDWGEPNDLGSSSSSSSNHGLSPAVSGAIGAIVALGIAGLIFAAILVFGGLRFHRVQSRKSEMGGFKGGQKMASDQDLTLPKGGAIVGATVETPGSPVAGGHERVGSWELKQHDLPNIAATHPARRPSFEEDEEVDISNRKPVRPDERV